MKTTPYFNRNIIKHDVAMEEVEAAWSNVVASEPQEFGRTAMWGAVPSRKVYLRMIVLEDGETLHNAFFDTGFTRKFNAGRWK